MTLRRLAACRNVVFGVVFSIYLHKQQHHNDDNKK